MGSRALRRDAARPLSELLFSAWFLVPLAVILAAFLASQFFSLTPRYLKLLVGAAFFASVLRLSLDRSLAFFCVLIPVPTFIFIADTNVLFVAFLLVGWAIQMGRGLAPRPVRTPIDWTVAAYLGVHVLSFINVDSSSALVEGLRVMQFLTAGIVFYILIVNILRTEEQLRRVLIALAVSASFVYLTGLVEYFGNGYQLVPEWFLYRGGHSPPSGGRIGGVFGFHGLLADWSAMMFYLQLVMALRARSNWARTWYYVLCGLSLAMIVLSVNRGGAVIFVLGGLYFLWLMRRQIRLAWVLLLAPIAAFASTVVELATGHWFTRLQLIGRIVNTQLQRGVPETRVAVWKAIWEKIPEHAIIGHGPFYDLKGGITAGVYWPHSAYLFYLYTTGVVGLLIFLWLIVKTLWVSRPRGPVDFRNDPVAKVTQALMHIQLWMFALAQIRDEHQRGNVYVYVMWLILGLAVASSAMVDRARSLGRRAVPGSWPERPPLRLDPVRPTLPGTPLT